MQRNVSTLLLALLSAVTSGPAGGSGQHALPVVSEEMPVVLTPARLRQPREQVPASVTVIDRDLIRASGAREIWELFRLVPGMSAELVDGNIPTVAYHATQARTVRRMQVLVDGRTQQRPGLARVEWNDLPLSIEDIERIEVTRGPNSAMYGANAMTGVINIITRHPADVAGLEVERRSGNNGVRDGRGTVATQGRRGALRMSVEQRRDNGYQGPDDDPFPDARRVENINLRGSYDLSVRDELELFAGASQSELEQPTSDAFVNFGNPRDHGHRTGHEHFVQLRWQRQVSPGHEFSIQLYGQDAGNTSSQDLCLRDPGTGGTDPGGAIYFTAEMRALYEDNDRDLQATLVQFHQQFQDPDTPIGERYERLTDTGPADPFCGDIVVNVDEQRLDLEVQDTRQLGDHARLVSGITLRHDRAESLAFASGTVRNRSRRAFANLELMPGDPLRVNLGGYWESDDKNETFFSPRAAVIMMPGPGHGLRAVYSEAVRALDLMETSADTTIRPRGLPEAWRDAIADDDILGQSRPDFFVTQEISEGLRPERITSRELGYFGRLGSLEMDLRFYHESLEDLVVSSLSVLDLEANNNSRVDHQGWEGQLGWHAGRHYLRGTLMRNRLENQRSAEGRFGPEESSSLLWQYRLGRFWRLSGTWYRARDYNEYRYERLGGHLAWRYPLRNKEVVLRGTVEHDRADEPVVFQQNVRGQRNRFWLSASLRFR